MNASSIDMSLVSRSQIFFLPDGIVASSLEGSLTVSLLFKRHSVIDHSFFVRIYDKSLINDEYIRLLHAKTMQIQAATPLLIIS
jgi:hypothetical protein